MMKWAILAVAAASLANAEYINEYVILPGHNKEGHVISPLPHEYVANTSLLSVFFAIAILTSCYMLGTYLTMTYQNPSVGIT